MSGHSKWSTIRHKKAIEDAKKGSVFTRVAKKIYLAVKQGGNGDPEKNASLRVVLDEARSVNMPSDNVRRAINRGLGIKEDGVSEFEVIYEGYLRGGVGIMVEVLTDNKNRTGGEIKMLFDRAGGSLGGPGSVAYLKNLQPPVRVKVPLDDKVSIKEMIDKLNEMEEVLSVWTNLEDYE
jgi:YebC/PmpR family DNA-binding regulatory protein